MGRGPKPAKSGKAGPSVARKRPQAEGAKVRDLEKRLAEALRDKSEALEQQTATAEILRLIAGTPTDLESVLGTVAETAMRVCGARDTIIYRCDGDVLRLACTRGPLPVSPSSLALPLNEKTVTGRSVVERRTIHVHDLAAVAASQYPEALSRGVPSGSRTVLATPLLHDAEPLGAILIRRGEVQAFTDKQIALLETFADQAVIAIENVRLFTELQEKNRALTQAHAQVTVALDQQTATSEILRVISGSPTDVQPIFEAIVRNAVTLCGALWGIVWRFDGDTIDVVGHHNLPPDEREELRHQFPVHTGARDVLRAARTGAVTNLRDIESASEVSPGTRARWRRRGVRSALTVPMRRENEIVGAIGVSHREPGAFSQSHVELL